MRRLHDLSTKQFIKLFSAGLFLLLLNAGAHASTAICAQVENDPASKSMLDPTPERIDGFDGYLYKTIGEVHLKLFVREPEPRAVAGNTKKPAILFFFGGAWEYGTVTEFAEAAKYFSRRGAVSILVDYRVFCRNGNSIADEISDAKSAVRYVRTHAAQFGINPDHIVVSGGSAGGHLALSTATIKDFEADGEDLAISSRPNLAMLMYPCSDATTDDEKTYGGDAIGNYGNEVSPLYHVHQKLPPMLIIQGTDDIVYQENKKLCAESTAFGNTCELIIYQGAPHGFFSESVDQGKWHKPALKKMDAFLTNAGYLRQK